MRHQNTTPSAQSSSDLIQEKVYRIHRTELNHQNILKQYMSFVFIHSVFIEHLLYAGILPGSPDNKAVQRIDTPYPHAVSILVAERGGKHTRQFQIVRGAMKEIRGMCCDREMG